MTKAHNILGLAFEEHRVLAAEVHIRSEGSNLHSSGELNLSNELSVGNAAEQGQQLRQFLKEKGFTAKNVVVGLPAKWLVAKELKIPPANAATLPGILSIQAERAFSIDPKDLVFDYYSPRPLDKGGKLLLMAMQRRRLAQINTLIKAAGLSVQAVTVTSYALRSIVDDGAELVIYARDGYFESWSGEADLPIIRHAAQPQQHDDDKVKALSGQIRRLLSLAPNSAVTAGSCHVTVFTGSAGDDKPIAEISRSFPGEIEIADGDTRLLSANFSGRTASEAGSSTAAAALALAGIQDKRLFVDFLHSRMVPGRRLPETRTLVWAGVACFVLLLALISVVWGWRQDVKAIATFSEQLSVMSDDITAAQEFVDRMSYAAPWTSRRPEFLECLSQLTLAFPEEGTIWATNLALHENRKGLITGKSLREESVLLVLDELKLNKVFQGVQMVYMRDVGRGTDEVSFAIQFKFTGGG